MQLSNRLVKDDFWTDTELMENLPPTGRMLYQGLWQLAEETGVLEKDPLAYKIQLFPADSEVSTEDIKEWIETLVDLGKLIEFSDNSEQYFYIKNFHKHQSFSHPPKPELPLPDFIKYIPNPEKYKAGAYEVHWGKINGTHEKGISYIGEPPESYEKLTKNTHDSHEKGTSNEIESESESESESETTYTEQRLEEIKSVHQFWLEKCKDINNARLTKNQKKVINTKIEKWSVQELKDAISNYRTIYDDESFYYSHNWTMKKFIKQGNGAPRFLPGLDQEHDGDLWKDYKKQNGDRKARASDEDWQNKDRGADQW